LRAVRIHFIAFPLVDLLAHLRLHPLQLLDSVQYPLPHRNAVDASLALKQEAIEKLRKHLAVPFALVMSNHGLDAGNRSLKHLDLVLRRIYPLTVTWTPSSAQRSAFEWL
jgi:hypothetical protein